MTFLDNLDPLLIGFILLTIATIILLVLVISIYLKMRQFLVHIEAKNIADSLTHMSDSLKDLEKFRNNLEIYLTEVEKRLRKSIRSVHTVRFNPFKGTGGGGNQSFATTLLNEEGNGVIISSIYSRDHVSIFSKPIKKHSSEYELSEEESESLKNAKMGLLRNYRLEE